MGEISTISIKVIMIKRERGILNLTVVIGVHKKTI